MVAVAGTPMPSPGVAPAQRILFCANLCVDHVCEVPTFPKEDSGQRALDYRKAIGGNGANSTRVLTQLRNGRSRVSWLGPVPRRDEPDAAFALGELEAAGVDVELLEEVGGDGLPSSFILASRDTAARTIVSARRGTGEMSAEHFAAAAGRAFAEGATRGVPCWCHLECRQSPAVMLKMATSWHAEASSLAPCPPLSLELEKNWDLDELMPLLRLCDHLLIDQGFAERQLADNILQRCHDAEASGARVDVRGCAQAGIKELPSAPDGAAPPKRPKLSSAPEGAAAAPLEGLGQHPALRFLCALRRAVGELPDGRSPCWVCTWGKSGSFALEAACGETFFQPAILQEKAVDSVGAGDTFIASYLHARIAGAGTQAALACGAAVAGRKVGQVGFANLRSAVPQALE
mmetsp:Transcript_54215/g.175253  ORF Transcript_54215/g.175253 Transcript_54215/m.175253 type:complete len:404 (-) Transcript_54215:106-1317(-)